MTQPERCGKGAEASRKSATDFARLGTYSFGHQQSRVRFMRSWPHPPVFGPCAMTGIVP